MAKLDSGLRFDAGVFFDSGPSTPKKTMNKITRNWPRLGRADRVAFFRKIADNLAKTPAPLANPNPPLADYEALVAAAEEKLKAITDLETALKAARTEAGPAVDAAAEATETMARRAEDALADNAAGITAIGFDIASATPSPVGDLTAPQELTTSMGDNEGELDWSVQPVRGAATYEIETTANPVTGPWKRQESSTRSSGTITGLPSGVRHYVRVRANGPKGPGPWSDISDRMVP
jgi:hypothetical protein